jgi:integrator complex subunit 6
MLLTFEDPPNNIKAGWKEHHQVFMNELKNLTATGMTTLGPSLKHSFDLLNLNRMQTGIDTYGQGRCPFYLEPSIIIVITDGGKLSSTSGVLDELTLPMHSAVPGSEMTKEPFRWDQRLFALVLRLTGTVPPENSVNSNKVNATAADASPINDMCEVTGGSSYSVASQRTLMVCLEEIVSKIQGGVVIHFEWIKSDPAAVDNEEITLDENGEDKSKSWTSCRKMIYVQRSAQKGYSVGHWPIPESFWPDLQNPTLPPRTAHPVVRFSTQDTQPLIVENLPFDKYEVESSPLTNVILTRKQPGTCWQCFIANSHKTIENGYPFGYLKASSDMAHVNLFVLPYNYPVLLPLLDDLMRVQHGKPGREWKKAFDEYLKNMPLYYAAPLKRALQRLGAPASLVPDSMETSLSFPILNHLKRLKNQAKAEFDKVITSIASSTVNGNNLSSNNSTAVNNGSSSGGGNKNHATDSVSVRLLTTSSSSSVTSSTSSVLSQSSKKVSDIALTGNTSHPRIGNIRSELNEFPNFLLRVREKSSDLKSQSYRNPYDVNRRELIDQIHRMRINFLQPPAQIRYQDEDQMHSLPVSQMGNYQDYLKRMPSPLRELESTPVRQHMFGNPFKIDKKGGVMVDETDIDLVGSGNGNGNGGAAPIRAPKRAAGDPYYRSKRRPGPLPKDFVIRPSPPSSPSPASSSSSPSPMSPAHLNDYVMLDDEEPIPTDPAAARIDDVSDPSSSITSITPAASDDDSLDFATDVPTKVPESPADDDEVNSMYSSDGKSNEGSGVAFVPERDTKFQGVNGKDAPSYNSSSPATSRTNHKICNNSTSSSNGSNLKAAILMNGLPDKKYLNGGLMRLNLSSDEIRYKKEVFNLIKRPGKSEFYR